MVLGVIDTASRIDWRELRLFDHIDLEDSWVLGWKEESEELIFDVEFSLWPGHAEYSNPKQEEYTCYRKARLIFPHCESVVGLKCLAEVPGSQDPDGSIDYGSIDSLAQVSGEVFEISGDFGAVKIKSEFPKICFEGT